MVVLLVIVVSSVLFFASAGSLLLLSKWFKMPEPTYKKSLLIGIYIALVAGVVWLMEAGVTHLLGVRNMSVVTTVASIEFFHFLFKKYYQAHWPKTLAILAAQAVITILLSWVLIILVRLFIFMPVYVKGEAMSPTYHDKDYLLVNKLTDDFTRSEIIVYKRENKFIIGRVIGLPGEKIEIKDGKVFVNNQLLSEPYAQGFVSGAANAVVVNDHYFVMGDNRGASYDSRQFGPISEENIVGKIFYERPLLTK